MISEEESKDWTPQLNNDGRGKECHICKQQTDDLAGNPSLWSMALPYPGGNGMRRCYHMGCVVEAVTAYTKEK